MTTKTSTLLKSFSPAIMTKAIMTFDRLTLLIISVCWAVTIAVMIFALYTINLSVGAKKDAEAALATEPTLPNITKGGVGGKELQVMIDRLQHRFPDITITWQNSTLTLAGTNGGLYHQWLTAIGQIDTIYPQFHWRIKDMCVGKMCGERYIMEINLVGDKVAIEMPQRDEK